jgi:hypothetical protein
MRVSRRSKSTRWSALIGPDYDDRHAAARCTATGIRVSLIPWQRSGGMSLAFGHRENVQWPNAQRLIAVGRQEGTENIYRVSVKPS